MEFRTPGSDLESLSNLCEICREIDIEGLLRKSTEEFPHEGIKVTEWPISAQNMENSDCKLCRIFASICSGETNTQQLRAFVKRPPGRTKYSEPQVDKPSLVQHVFFVMLSIHKKRERKKQLEHDPYGASNSVKSTRQGLIVPQWRGEHLVRHIDPAKVDFGSLQSHLQSCNHNHPDCQKRIALWEDIKWIRLIDCREKKEVDCALIYPPFPEYLTLSYCWGNKEARGSLNRPVTVVDAVIATRNLGFDYIWVDQECIDQDCEEDKGFWIARMNIVFGNAEGTIVALSGDDYNAGLPGVTTRQRMPQAQISFATFELCATLPTVREAIKKSSWNTRCWTYGEARLSRRLFVFSDYQAYFICRSDSNSETIQSASSSISDNLNYSKIGADLLRDNMRGSSLVLDRFAYTHGYLSMDKDTLNAFLGILSQSGWVSFWGVPIVRASQSEDFYDGLAMGLTWKRPPYFAISEQLRSKRQPPEFGDRHPLTSNFPSWSWPSKTGPIFFESGSHDTTLGSYVYETDYCPSENLSKIFAEIVNEHGQRSPLHTAIAKYKSFADREMPHSLFIVGEVVNVKRLQPERKPGSQNEKERWEFQGSPQNISKTIFWSPDKKDDEDLSVPHRALVLIHWRDQDQKPSQRRFVLMVLKDEDKEGKRFKRLGLLSRYSVDVWSEKEIAGITRTKMEIEIN